MILSMDLVAGRMYKLFQELGKRRFWFDRIPTSLLYGNTGVPL